MAMQGRTASIAKKTGRLVSAAGQRVSVLQLSNAVLLESEIKRIYGQVQAAVDKEDSPSSADDEPGTTVTDNTVTDTLAEQTNSNQGEASAVKTFVDFLKVCKAHSTLYILGLAR